MEREPAQEGIVFGAIAQRAAGDLRHLEVLVALSLAGCDKETLETLPERSDLPRDVAGLLPHRLRTERKARRKGIASRARIQLAERLLAIEQPDEATLRTLLDEASLGNLPRDLCVLWLPLAARALAGERLGEATGLLAEHDESEPLDQSLLQKLSAGLDRWVADPDSPMTESSGDQSPQMVARHLEVALSQRGDRTPSELRKLGMIIARCERATVALPLLCAALAGPDTSPWRRLRRALRRSPFAAPVIVMLLTDPSLRELDTSRLLELVPSSPDTALAAALFGYLWSAPAHDKWAQARCWRALGDLGEPAALADQMMSAWGISAFPNAQLPQHPGVVSVLLRMVRRRDPRLEALWDSREERTDVNGLIVDTPPGPFLWSSALMLVPDAARRWGRQDEARRVLRELLLREQAIGAELQHLQQMALSLGRLGDPAALYILCDMLARPGNVSEDVYRALHAVGPAASAATPTLKEAAGEPWAWVALAGIEPDEPLWVEHLLSWLAAPDMQQTADNYLQQYVEGLITPSELEMKLLLLTEAAQICRARSDAGRWAAATAGLASIVEAAGEGCAPELYALLRG